MTDMLVGESGVDRGEWMVHVELGNDRLGGDPSQKRRGS